MKIEFTLNTADDAAQAADILDHIAAVLSGAVAQQDTVKPARTRRTKAQIAADAAVTTLTETITAALDVVDAARAAEPANPGPDVDLTAPFKAEMDALKAAAPAIVPDTAADEAAKAAAVVETPATPVVVDPPAETAAPVLDRATLESETRTACLTLGVVWLRENGPQKFGKQKLSDLSDAELLTTHTAAKASVAALAR